ncbi:MAG: DUF368 domain-containing protein, partial [Haloarculaceae archaeon]
VSGGTIALITGIYERLITAVTSLDPTVLGRLTDLASADGRRAFWAELIEMDVPFLAALGLGFVTALVVFSRVAHAALTSARAATFAFFLGLIAASAVVLYSEVDVSTPGRIGAGIAGFVIAFFVSGLSAGGPLGHSVGVVFVSGTIAVSAMILPGISGASLLLLLGQYEYLAGTLKRFVDELIATVAGGGTDALVTTGTTVVTFVAGAVVGLFTISHVIKRALARYREATLTFLVSLLVGTLRVPVIEIRATVEQWGVTTAAPIVIAAVAGVVAVVVLDRYTDDLSY